MEQKTALKEWTSEEAIRFITNNPDWSDFLKGKRACIIAFLESVKFLIYRNDTKVELFFGAPDYPELNCLAVECFFKAVKPYICKKVKEEEFKRLTEKDF